MTLKLYYDLLSQPSRAVYIFLKVCNIPFEKKLINLGKIEHHTPEFKKISPFQKVPSIQHNDFNMIESIAILRYLCREFTVPDHWYPKDSKAQAKVDEYLEWQHMNTRLNCALYFRQKYLMPIITGKPTVPEQIAKYEKQMVNCLDLLENVWLKQNLFLIGSEISIADLLGTCEVEQVRIAGYDPRNGRPRLASWMTKVAEITHPYYEEAHIFLNKLANKAKENSLKSKI
nr:glutathione S-transferase theta-1-like [Nomia melanderi]XP_031829004.1 glutathione S-transferase theta-1-like [Nomia melanderi]XP_031829005.1 glutathione S-transferase theta-1-like [Nomia melanderi]